MLKILVVDDEPKHRRCLAEMIRVLRPQYKVLEAKNGKEALEFIKSESMDIIITDIRMPIMDGLSLMESINNKISGTKVIILSGFAYFDYAQKALSLGAFDYVLKPVNEAKISEILDKVEKAIEKENQEQQNKINMEKQLNTAFPAYIEQKFNEWVNGYLNADGLEEIEKIFPYKGNGFVIATEISGLSDILKDYNSDEIYEIKLNVKQWMKETLQPVGHTISFFLESNRNIMITILNTNTRCDVVSKDNPYMLNDFVQNMKASYGLDALVGIGSEYEDIFSNIKLSFDESLQALNYKLYENNGGIFLFSDYKDHPNSEFSREYTLINNVKETLPIADFQMASGLKTLKPSKHDKIIKACEKYVSEHYMDDIPLDSIAEMFRFNSSYFSSYFKNNTGINFSDYLQSIRMQKAEELLKSHDLKVYEVAKSVGYQNVKYFNKVFKKEYGVSPDEYRRVNNI